jgi:hypothetical protein
METLELPSVEEQNETLFRPEVPPVNFADQEIDLAAFRLWREASRFDSVVDESGTET